MCGVIRRRRQLAEDGDHFVRIDFSCFRQRAPANQGGQSRSASHRGNAALGLESDLNDSSICNSHRKRQHITANWVFKLRDRIGRIGHPCIARMLKVIEELGGVHGVILERAEKSVLLIPKICHPERSRCFAKRSIYGVEGPRGHQLLFQTSQGIRMMSCMEHGEDAS